MTIYCCSLSSDVGEVSLAERDGVLLAMEFDTDAAVFPGSMAIKPGEEIVWGDGRDSPARRQLAEYFAGLRHDFDLLLSPSGTEFQRAVWAALETIPFGATCCYSDIAERIGRPRAVRAVGAANGKNPIAIVVPCHRVIGRDGSLTGYGGGLDRKQWLLEHEGVGLPLLAGRNRSGKVLQRADDVDLLGFRETLEDRQGEPTL